MTGVGAALGALLRPALAAAGERGVDHVLAWLRDDMRRTMSLVGAGTIGELDRSLLDLPKADR